MSTEATGAAQIVAAYDEAIRKLEAVKALILNAGPALDGWTCGKAPSLSPLIQLHRREGADPKAAAKAIAPAWTRQGSAWHGALNEADDLNGWQVILHDAEPARPKADVVEL